MAITVTTPTPNDLLASIKKAIDAGHIQTWAYDNDGDFTHSAQQWNRLAWLRPSIATGALVFSILPRKGVPISKEVYGIYHGRFIEMLLVHFDERFSDASSSALPAWADTVTA